MFFIEKAQQVMSLVESVVRSVGNIARGDIGGAAAFIEQSMARAIPLVIGFIADLIGLGGLSNKVQEFVKKAKTLVWRGIDAVLKKVAKIAEKIIKGAVKMAQKLAAKVKGKDKKAKDSSDAKPQTPGDPKKKAEFDLGVAYIHEQEAPYQEEGLSKEKAEAIAASAKQQHHVFNTISVVDGGARWDYVYTSRLTGARKPKKINISLTRPSFTEETKKSLKDLSPDAHKMSVTGKNLVKVGYARRHIVPVNQIRTNYLEKLNGKTPQEAAALLAKIGVNVDSPTEA